MIWVAYVFTAIALLMSVGTIAWQTPWIGFFGSVGGHVPGWLLGFAGIGVVSGVAAWILQPSAGAVIAVLFSLLSAGIGAKIISDQKRALAALGVTVRAKDFFGPYSESKAGPDDVVTYGPVDGYSPRIGVYKPAPSDAPAPVVVHIHGGGWSAGNESGDSWHVRQLTHRGYLVFTPTYTYAAEGAPTWDLAPRQIARALAEIKRIAPQYGGNADRVFLTGSSAGGHLAPLIANRLAEGDTFGEDAADLPQVAAMALMVPAVDPAFAEGNNYVPTGASAKKIVTTFIGGSSEEFPERYEAVNATGHLNESSPPALLVYGPNDWLVPSQGPLAYALRSRQLSVDVKAVPVPWTGHLLGLNGAAGRAMGQLTAEWFDAYRA